MEINNTFEKNLQILPKLAKFWSKVPENVNKISPEFTLFSQYLNLDNYL